ncbi:MAG: signal peptide peptidase SppA [Crocinitomicaceae bacterium]|nr:signal peptide peptidase SppA [Crocinitomicaceae bacterium]
MNMTFWKTFWASLLASVVSGLIVIGLFFLILGGIMSGLEDMMDDMKLHVKDNTVLHMKLNGPIGDYTAQGFDANTFSVYNQFGLMEILEGIEMAKEDDKVKGIFLECNNVLAGMATVKEIRDALVDFQESGKFVVSYSENYSTKSYYLSSAAKELYVFPTGMIQFLGLGGELMFFKGTLEKLDVEMQIIRGSNNKFKSAVEPLMNTEMSEANREQTMKYLSALWGQILEDVATSRNLKESRLNTIADSVMIRKSGDAVGLNMADGIKYYDEVLDLLKEKAGTDEEGNLALLSFKKYAIRKTKKNRTLEKLDKKNIALIFAQGDIVDGKGTAQQIGGNRVSAWIREAREDENIKAIVLRVNSPGGSALASDVIWREVVKTKEAGKPVIVSMGDLAASGGYYISCAADKIYAQPNTLTGSIGVFGIIPYTGKMFENKLGVTFDRVQTNAHSVLSTNKKLDEWELNLVQQEVDDIYDDFISKVAEGRGMKKSAVDSIGQGRVWAGKDAIEIGLVDEIGGLNDAIDYAAEQAGIKEVKLDIYPRMPKPGLEGFIEAMEDMDASIEAKIPSELELQLMQMYGYLKSLDTKKSIQARLPFIITIE